ncbi:hypothetical protein IKH83_00380 [Candidatus Saccharibacteria bacterium]|nr:hypothetical protein [Candidatus Saccharibacteria bacterium]
MKKILPAIAMSAFLAAMPVMGAFAIDSQSHDVTIGSVDEATYDIDIIWDDDMVFDWKYDRASNSFDFKARRSCHQYGPMSQGSIEVLENYITASKNYGLLYSDENCSVAYTGSELDLENNSYYIKDTVGGHVLVADLSDNGSVSASVSFEAEDNYNWVTGNFANFANVEASYKNDVFYYNDPSELTNSGKTVGLVTNAALCVNICGPYVLDKYLYLEKAAGATVDSQSVTTSDKIGTVTINITPNE